MNSVNIVYRVGIVFIIGIMLGCANNIVKEWLPYDQMMIIIVDDLPIFDEPNGKLIKTANNLWAEEIDFDSERTKLAPKGWVGYQVGDRYGHPIKDKFAWLRRQDLWDGKPKKVVACWPIKRIEYTVGHWAIEINFKTDGSGEAYELTDTAEGNLSPYETHAYMSQNIVLFRALDKDKRYFFTAGYKPEDRHLYPRGTKDWTEQTLFTPEELKGCTAQPVVQE